MSIQQQLSQATSPQITSVVSQGLHQIFQNKPDFPITYLANWLKSYSSSKKLKQTLINSKKPKQQKYQHIQKSKVQLKQRQSKENQQKKQRVDQRDREFEKIITQTKHLEDLLEGYLPEVFEKSFQLTGVYVGRLDFNKKNIQQGNFEPGAENDTENPKVITYIGASKSHEKLMIGNSLPDGKGVSYDIFQEAPQPEQTNEEQQANVQQKKTYLYISNVLKQSKLHYFKYPRLGAYVCYPIKIKSCLNIPTLDKAIVDYKAYLKTKQQTEKQYVEKIAQARAQTEDAVKKIDSFQMNQEDPASQQQKKTLQGEAQEAEQKLQELLKSPPIIQEVEFDTFQQNFFIGCDTLGQDKQISESNLQNINTKVQLLIKQWQAKQRKMVLTDILTFLQQESQLQNIENLLLQHERNLASNYQSQIKQQFLNKEKQGEFQFFLIKCEKTRQLLTQNNFKASMDVYLNYNVPKFAQLVQIWCLLLGYDKNSINLPQSNQLNQRKMINKDSFKNLLQKLGKYQLKRDSSEPVSSDYKINKLLQRLQKIDVQGLAKYNVFLFILHYLLKTYCWSRIFCRDAKKQTFQTKTKLKQERDNQIQKWSGEIQRNIQSAKAQLDQEGQQNFKEQDWRKTYQAQNPRPQPLDAPVQKQFLDIQ